MTSKEQVTDKPDFQEEAKALMKLFSTSKSKVQGHPITVDSLDHYDLVKALEYYHAAKVKPLKEENDKLREALKDASDVLVLASLIDKSNTCDKEVSKIDAILNRKRQTKGRQ